MNFEKSILQKISDEDFGVVKSISPFSAIPEEELRNALADSETRRYRTFDTVADENDFPKGLCVVVEGVLVAENRSDTRVIALNAFMKGDMFGAAALFAGEERRYSSLIVARRPSRLVEVKEETVKKFIASSPEFALSFTAYLAGKIRFLNKKLTGYTSKSSVRSLLQYLEVACAETCDGTAKINISSAAEELSMSRTTIYAAAETLEKGGFIKRDGKYYTLLRA